MSAEGTNQGPAAVDSGGYVTDLDYVDVVHSRMAPVWLEYVAALQGVQRRRPAPGYDYCDLGCGTGLSLSLLAASDRRGRFVGIDFNPRHIARADELARAGGLDNARFMATGFAGAATLDLPEFDYISLYGVLSWVGPEARRQALDFVRRKLKPDGLVLVAYNAMPGSASLAPLRRFMLEATAATNSKAGGAGTAARIGAAQDALAALKGAGAQYLRDHPAAARALDSALGDEQGYLAHEYFNEHWHLPYFAEMRRDLDGIGLAYVGSVMTETNAARLCIPPPLRPLYERAPDLDARELIKDLMLGRKFRVEVFVRGGRRVAGDAHVSLFDGLSFALPERRAGRVPRRFNFPAARVELRAEIAGPLIAALAAGPVSLDALARLPGLAQVARAELIGELTILVASREVQPAIEPASGRAAAAIGRIDGGFRFAAALSAAVLDRFLTVDRARFVAAPALGTGLQIGSTDGLLLMGLVAAGLDGAADWAAEEVMRRRLVIANAGGRLSEQAALAAHFVKRIDAHWRPFYLDRLLALGVIEPVA
jgi:SAM-dependent methyltransferase